jgi:hypothetical protein
MHTFDDEPSKLAAKREHVPLGTFIERLDLPSITQVKIKASASPHLGEEAP